MFPGALLEDSIMLFDILKYRTEFLYTSHIVKYVLISINYSMKLSHFPFNVIFSSDEEKRDSVRRGKDREK